MGVEYYELVAVTAARRPVVASGAVRPLRAWRRTCSPGYRWLAAAAP